jgi:UDP-N-acetylmuramate--alanine ligase
MLSQPPPIVKTAKLKAMHVYFSGIGGTGIGPLALIAKQAGYEVSGSDAKDGKYLEELRRAGINLHIGQLPEQIAEVHSRKPIDWFIYSSALPKTDPDHPELRFCEQNGIKSTKRDEFLNMLLTEKNLKLIAVAGTHGKTTTTAMIVWLFKESGLPVSYSVGAKLPFGGMGQYEEGGKYFVYEADEYDRNFLSFYPELSLITGLDWDHQDIYPTQESYFEAFSEFTGQSDHTYIWKGDAGKLGLEASEDISVLDEEDPAIDRQVRLPGHVNRLDGWLAANALQPILNKPLEELVRKLNDFPGVSRRFEKIADKLYTDYAHTPPKIRGALQLAHEVAGDNVVVVYEGLHNTRQHFIKDELKNLFDDVKQLYVVPSYLARENKDLELLTPDKLLDLLSNSARDKASAAVLDDSLKAAIRSHIENGELVLALSAGGAGSLDEWLRREFKD